MAHVHVSGELTIYNVVRMRQQLATAVGPEDSLSIDLGEVAEIDTAGIQLLMTMKRERECAGLEFILSNHSESVLSAFEHLGLLPYFNDPVVIKRAEGDK
jgi:anti-anti-sigma factor